MSEEEAPKRGLLEDLLHACETMQSTLRIESEIVRRLQRRVAELEERLDAQDEVLAVDEVKECNIFDHYRLACPNCGGPVQIESTVCFGLDPHNTYRCSDWTCVWRGRDGLSIGSPEYIHDDDLHEKAEE